MIITDYKRTSTTEKIQPIASFDHTPILPVLQSRNIRNNKSSQVKNQIIVETKDDLYVSQLPEKGTHKSLTTEKQDKEQKKETDSGTRESLIRL